MLIKEKINMDKVRKELSFAVTKAVGYNSVGEFSQKCRIVNAKMIVSLIEGDFVGLPDRKLLRKIADNSQGRVTYKLLYDICGYSENDPEEDKTWREWTPKRGEVYFCDLGYNLDCEQSGSRPVLVIQNDIGNKYSPTVVVIPISTANKKMSNKIHVFVPKEYGLDRDSYILTEQIRVVSKRRFFCNSVPWKLTELPGDKIKEVQNALEFELGMNPLIFNEGEAFKMIEHIKKLKQNIETQKSRDLIDVFNDKVDNFIKYCAKYGKNHDQVIKEYKRLMPTPV